MSHAIVGINEVFNNPVLIIIISCGSVDAAAQWFALAGQAAVSVVFICCHTTKPVGVSTKFKARRSLERSALKSVIIELASAVRKHNLSDSIQVVIAVCEYVSFGVCASSDPIG